MRISVVTESFPPRADEVADTTRHVVDGLYQAGYALQVLTNGHGCHTYRGVEVVRSRRLARPGGVAGAIEAFGPDLAIVIAPRMLGSVAVRHANRRHVPTLTVDPPPVHVRGSRTLATSNAGLTQLSANGVPGLLWQPGVDLAEHHPRLRDERLRSAWAKGNALVVGHLGEVGREKVVNRLTRIAQMDDVRLVVFGDGPGAADLRAAGAKVTGATTGLDLARGLASLDVLVQPRKRDHAVPAVRRALASGVPVVAFDAGGAADVVSHEHNGLLCAPDKGRRLREAIRRLADEPGLREELAENARPSVEHRSWEQAIEDLEGHLGQVVHELDTSGAA